MEGTGMSTVTPPNNVAVAKHFSDAASPQGGGLLAVELNGQVEDLEYGIHTR
jgi:hypothetical protein